MRVGDAEGLVPRPSLLGAIIAKAEAVGVDDAPEAQREDLAFLLSIVDDPGGIAAALDRKDKVLPDTHQDRLDGLGVTVNPLVVCSSPSRGAW